MPTHEITVEYTNEDNGIWLMCTCGWDSNHDFWPSLADLNDAAQAHLAIATTAQE